MGKYFRFTRATHFTTVKFKVGDILKVKPLPNLSHGVKSLKLIMLYQNDIFGQFIVPGVGLKNGEVGYYEKNLEKCGEINEEELELARLLYA